MKGSEVQNETKNTTTINTHTKYAEVYKYIYRIFESKIAKNK